MEQGMEKCLYEKREGGKLLHCRATVEEDSEGVWDGFKSVPICDSCLENPDVLFCLEDEAFHFKGTRCQYCGRF